MTKFNFFLVVEALLLTLGLITIFNNDINLTFSGFHVEYLCGACYPSGCGLCHDKPFFTG